MAEYAAPFAASTIATSQQYRDRYRPTQWDLVDDNVGGTGLQCSNAANVNISVANGSAVVQGALYQLTGGPQLMPVTANGGGSNRFDIVVLRYDAAGSPGVKLATVVGTPGSGMPALTRVATGVWEMPICHYEKQPGGNVVNLVDRRIFSDGTGGIVGPDVNWAPVGPGRRTGMRFRDWTTGTDHTYNGTSWVEDNILNGWTTFTPSWAAAGTQPAIGNGIITGRYRVLPSKTVAFVMRITAGTTTTYGTTSPYSFGGLPTAPMQNVTNLGQIVQCYYWDSSASTKYYGYAYVAGGSTWQMQVGNGTANLTTVSPTSPVVPANLDEWSLWGIVEVT
jgi:hypothetical protein